MSEDKNWLETVLFQTQSLCRKKFSFINISKCLREASILNLPRETSI